MKKQTKQKQAHKQREQTGGCCTMEGEGMGEIAEEKIRWYKHPAIKQISHGIKV